MVVALIIILSTVVLNITARNAISELSKNLKISVYLKDDAPQADINGCWVFYKNPHKATVRVLSSDEQEDIVLPMVEDEEYFAGVNILPKNFAVPANP